MLESSCAVLSCLLSLGPRWDWLSHCSFLSAVYAIAGTDSCVHLDVSVLFQLIDLGSPLIQLSPEADKENVDSPLLKF